MTDITPLLSQPANPLNAVVVGAATAGTVPGLSISDVLEAVTTFTFVYPLSMSFVWMLGALLFYWRTERHDRDLRQPVLQRFPSVSILVPCFNEEKNVADVVDSLMRVDYPTFEVIAINDGSTDRTAALLDEQASRHPRLRVIHLSTNQGKAVGLDTASFVARGEIIVGIDGDAVLDPQSLRWLVRHFDANPRLGAVTGNPRIRTRSTLLGRLQVAEFSSMVGLIKRAQQALLGRLFTVSGVIAAFRASALKDIGYWSHDMLTEDIDVSWKLQTRGWLVRFEPNALVWILMPETVVGLWRQRLRWATGGVQVVHKFRWLLRDRRQWRMWPVYIEYVMSLIWAHAMLMTMALSTVGVFASLPAHWTRATLLPGWCGVGIASACMMQFTLSVWMDSRYDVRLHRYLWSAIWYPVVFWMVGMTTSVAAGPKFILRRRGQRAVWVSPDRGLQQVQR